MSKKPEHGKKQPAWKVVRGVGLEILQGKKKEHHHSGEVDGKTKYTLLCCLLVKLGSQVLRDVFDRTIQPQDLCSALKNEPAHSKLQSFRKEGILNPVQWSQLYPVKPSSVSSTGFDPSLLIVLLRTICNLSPPSSGWDLLPHSLDTSCESDIVRLKYFVDSVSASAKEASVSDAVFCNYKDQIQKTLLRLGGAEYEDAIHELEKHEMGPLDEEHFKELLKRWKDDDDRIKDKLNEWECTMKTSRDAGAVDGRTKYTLLCCLLVRLGSQVLRDVFDRTIRPQELCNALQHEPVHSQLQSLRKEGILNPVQWSQLYPVKPSSVSSTGFDPSLLIVLLRTICNLSPPPSGWDLLPHSLDTSCESDIVRLKYFVGAVSASAKEASVSDAVFCNNYKDQIQKTLVRLGGAEYEDAIHELEKHEMGPLDEEHFKELLKRWKDDDDRIKDKLNEWECTMKTSRDAGAVDGKTKYTLLCCLLVRLGSQVLRDVFDRTIRPQDLRNTLQHEPVHSQLQSLRKEGILNLVQWSQLYPVKPSSVSSTGFDPSLLIVLLRTICNLSPPSCGWDLLPHSLDTSCESDIVRLKYCVNALSAHAGEASVSDATFCKYREQIQNTLVRLGGAEYEDAFRGIEKQEMDPWDEEHFKELLKQWKDGDDRIKDKLNEWECIMKTSGEADRVQPEASCTDVVSAAATGSSTHTHHEQGAVDGRTKYTLLCCLLVRLGSQVLRDVFDRTIHPQDVCSALKNEPAHSKLQSLRKEGILNSVQWSQLYPENSSSVSSTGFGPSLLIVLLRTICNLSPPSCGWDLLPHSLDASCESDIVRLKYCVNALSAHAGEASVSDATFCKYREQIQNTLVRLGGAEYEDAIREIEKQEMDPWDEEHFKELLKQWKDGDDRIKDKLNEWECIMKTSGEAGCGISPSNQQNDQRIDSKANGHSNAKHANSMQSNSEESLLHSAAKVGDVNTIEKILPNELDIDSRNSNGATPLMIAALEGRLDAFSVLIERKSDPTLKGKDGWTLLHYAAKGGNNVIIEKLLSLGLDIDSRSSDGATPLMIAAIWDRLDAFSVLIERKSDPILKNNNGETLLHYAVTGGNDVIIEKLLSLGLDIDSRRSNGATPLMIAALCGRLNAFSVLIERRSDPTLKSNNGWTLLHYAVQGGNDVIIEKLLSLGLDIDSRSSDGATPLMIAALQGRLDAFSVLIERRSDPTLKDNNGWTLLHYAAQGGNDVIIEKLLSLGLDIDSRNRNGTTPLMIAASNGRLDAFSVLIERRSDPTLKNNNGYSLLHYAAQGGNDVIIDKLLSLGFDIDSRSSDGATPLMIAALCGRLHAFSVVRERRSDPSLKDNNGKTLLHYAAQGDNDVIIEKLLSLGLDIDSRRSDGLTPLRLATIQGNDKAANYFLKRGARH
ncbi:uncharacterized protein [Montipora capricornis]|uniref:uncharacterized protein isoform X1 n=1 Tax=Montipora capricornis TaxID=246305 RepID=UPI0035F21CA8